MAIKDRSNCYIGETNNMLRDGFGVYVYENKFFKYEGEWKNGEKHGHGRLVMADGSYYEGQFDNGEISGKGERFWSKSKNVYRGEFKNGELHGMGIMFYGNRDKYDGEWNLNSREGSGHLVAANGDEYEGEFYKNKPHGEGMMSYMNGSIYTGYWVCGKQHGHGKITLHDGSVYEGQFSYDLFHGEGSLFHLSGITYKGLWEQNLPDKIPRKMKLAAQILDCFQGHTFSTNIVVVTEDDEVVVEESGRTLRISAAIKYQHITETNSLFELIEQMHIHPIDTPLYPVLPVPLTNNPPKWVTELIKIRNQKWKSSPVFELNEDDETDVLDGVPADSPAGDLLIQANEMEQTSSEPVVQITENGTCQFSNLFIQQPDKLFPAYLLKDQEAGVLSLDSDMTMSANTTSGKPSNKDPTCEDQNARRKRLGDENFTRPGEYVLIVEDITENPFMSICLEPLYTTINILPFSVPDASRVSNVKESQNRRRSHCNSNKTNTGDLANSNFIPSTPRRSSDLF